MLATPKRGATLHLMIATGIGSLLECGHVK